MRRFPKGGLRSRSIHPAAELYFINDHGRLVPTCGAVAAEQRNATISRIRALAAGLIKALAQSAELVHASVAFPLNGGCQHDSTNRKNSKKTKGNVIEP
jgi:hypothetical protein